jgi:uncharacterized protein (DUF983 family)
MQLLTILHRSLRLRCPRCGRGKVFAGWFRMLPRCNCCELIFDREPGYFLGSIYFNYGLTAAILVVAGTAGFVLGVHQELLTIALAVFCLAFPLWFFRYARCLWMGFDEHWDPRPADRSEAIQILDQAIRLREQAAGSSAPASNSAAGSVAQNSSGQREGSDAQ